MNSILYRISTASKMNWSDPETHSAICVVDITPELAEALLEKTPKTQRPLRDPNVQKLRRCILSGRWRWTGIPIVITQEGKLIDGQHRLTASLQERFTMRNSVVSIVADADVYRAIDVASRRSRTDQLRHAQGGTVGFNGAAQAGLVYEHVGFAYYAKNLLSTDEETDVVLESPFAWVALDLQGCGSPTGPMIAAAIRCAHADPHAAVAFFSGALRNDHTLGVEASRAVGIVATRMLSKDHRRHGLDKDSRNEISIYIKAFSDWFAGNNGKRSDGKPQTNYRAGPIPSRGEMAKLKPHARVYQAIGARVA